MPLILTKTGSPGNFLLTGMSGRFSANAPVGQGGVNIVTSGLILRLDAEDTNSYNGSGTAWNDLSPSASNATLVGNPTFNATSPKYFAFDGINDHVTFPANFFNQNGGVPFTISIWFRALSTGGILLGQQSTATVNTGADYVPAIYIDTSGKLRTMTFWGGSVDNGSVSTAAVNDGLWHNITVTFESSSQKSYLDGQLYATLSKTQGSYAATYYYFLGSGRYSAGGGGGYADTDGSPYFTGNIATFDFYNRALSGGEVLQNYNALLPRYNSQAPLNGLPSGVVTGSVLTYLDAESYAGTGTTWDDISLMGNAGVLVNNPTYVSSTPKSFNFDGVNDYVSLPGNFLDPDGGVPFSISMWFKTSTRGVLLGQQSTDVAGAGGNFVPGIYVDTNGKLRTSTFWGGSVNNQSVSTTSVNDNAWHNVTVTFESSSQKSYLDGQLYATLSKTQSAYAATYYYFVGGGSHSGWTNIDTSFFSGSIAVFNAYSRALSDAEVLQNYNSVKTTFGL